MYMCAMMRHHINPIRPPVSYVNHAVIFTYELVRVKTPTAHDEVKGQTADSPETRCLN